MSGAVPRKGVVTAGTWCADHNKIVDTWPAEDEIAEILVEEIRGGGSACNMAIDLKRLDPAFPVETIGMVGDDADGRLLLGEADSHGIDRRQLRVVPGVRSNYTDAFTSRRSGRRTHLYHQGTSALITPDDCDFEATSARFLHLGLPGVHRQLDNPWQDDPNGWVTILRKARAAGLETNLELCSIPAERIAAIVRPCLPHLDLLIINDVEIGAIAGTRTSPDGETDVVACREAATSVLAAGAMRLLVVHFPRGAIAIGRDGAVMEKPSVEVPVGEIVGANGAGDAFASGVLYGLHEGWPVEESLVLGHAAAAASLRSLGTSDGVQPWRACLDLAGQWGWRTAL